MNPAIAPNGLFSIRFAVGLSLVSLLWSTALLTNFSFALIGPEKLGLVFNDMAERLLHLDMTIDPAAITFEAFVKAGRTYTYFGIFPAVLRLPLILLGAANVPLARISCLLALWIINFMTIRITQSLLATAPATPPARLMQLAALLGVCFSGPVIYILASASIYHEAIFWGAAWTAIFNLIVVRRIVAGSALTGRDYRLLAFSAGCALMSRVTCGVTLYAALTLLAIWPALEAKQIGAGIHVLSRTLRLAAPAIAIATAFIAAQAAINYGRWGNALTMVPFEYYQTWDPAYAERMAVIARHGGLEAARIPVAALHYALGIKVDEVFSGYFREHYFGIEGPRIVALLCAPWMVVCSAIGMLTKLSRPLRSGLASPLLIANALGFLMLLTVFDLALRYTFDGWAFLSLSTAFGARWLMSCGTKVLSRRLAHTSVIATLLGILVSHATLLRYKINYSGTDPAVRYWLSRQIQPHLCPNAPLNPAVKLTDFNPLVTPTCPPLW